MAGKIKKYWIATRLWSFPMSVISISVGTFTPKGLLSFVFFLFMAALIAGGTLFFTRSYHTSCG